MRTAGGLRENWGLYFFIPEGRTYSLLRRKVRLSPFPPYGENCVFFLVPLFPQSLLTLQSLFSAVGWSLAIVRSPRGIVACAKAYERCHSPLLMFDSYGYWMKKRSGRPYREWCVSHRKSRQLLSANGTRDKNGDIPLLLPFL